MGLNNNYSDYGSGSSSSSSPWMSQQDIRWSSFPPQPSMERPNHKSSSYSDLVMGRCTLEDVMREFQMNGSDSPYNPDEDRVWGKHNDLCGSSASAYRRQVSWPAPERSPAPRLPRHAPLAPLAPLATSTPVFDEPPTPFAPSPSPAGSVPPAGAAGSAPPAGAAGAESLSAAQARVLSALPAAVLHSLLRQLHTEKRNNVHQECRFCKNNGEREVYYRSHMLKDGAGRVACPVLRALTCSRCGARGDHAHTIKYCPLSTNEERIKSAAMMRSVRMASGRRRAGAGAGTGSLPPSVSPRADYVVFGEPTASVVHDNNVYSAYNEAPLDPLWAALEQKLML